MTDFVIKTGNGNDPREFMDGDIVAVFSRRMILARYARAEWRTYMQRTPTGEYDGDGLHAEIQRVFHRKKFLQVSATEIQVIPKNPARSPYIVGPTPNANGEAVALPEFLARRRASGKKLFKNAAGEVFWFGGEYLPPRPQLNALWVLLEAAGSFKPRRMQHSQRVRRSPNLLPSKVTDFTEDEASTYVDPEVVPVSELDAQDRIDFEVPPDIPEDTPITVRARKRKVDWKIDLELTQRQIDDQLDQTRDSDYRETMREKAHGTIAKQKGPR